MIKTKRKNLLVVCAGDNSLHSPWAEYRDSFDIITIYYGDDSEIAEGYRRISDLFFRSKGLKMSLARRILFQHLYMDNAFDFSEYVHVWFPDDDLKFTGGDQDIEQLFAVANATAADVFQPAIQNENFSAMWESTRLIAGAFAHRTNIVEIMAHGFSGEVFAKCFLSAVHVCEFMKSGWGIEPVWTKFGEALFRRALRTYVFDSVSVVHTRPVGSGDSCIHRVGQYEATYMPQIHTNRMKTFEIYNDLEALQGDVRNKIENCEIAIEAYHKEKFDLFIKAARKN